ncbi:hypothetical protein F0562_025744 [Nyssa sinensis]|uniref:ubiquitinyl hydrolase 1 n=1 Tax=Nyssa sinensis TaxID=561372 RepID=A0A5J5BAY8_9ASTE|nr:hypothetical protein F0562_025744 [Nyssa sinensis]
MDARSLDDSPSKPFTWTIENFSKLTVKKLYSEVFYVGGYNWRVLLFPKGNNVDHLSIYLDVADSAILPYGWSRYAQFGLAVINKFHKFTVRKGTQHQFNAQENDWGFTSFMPLSELNDPGRGYLVNDTCIVEADVAVHRVVDDLKKETGYFGLKKQGATCYMNSLLQTLYHIPYFRKAVYHMPTTENDMPSGGIPLALKILFCELRNSNNSVATEELMKSFGWDTHYSFLQHDIRDINRVLCEKIEDKMKGTVFEGVIQQLFEGHHMNCIEYINVNSKSTRKESFYDLQLDVKGCRDVYASFDKYVEMEHLEGDNKYHAEQHGIQDARKGVLFIDFPPVLQLQLKRFEYDIIRDTTVKINDRYEFPLQLDLDRENGKYLSPEADRSVRNLYSLHSVLVHSGGVHGGHFYAFIRPTLSDQWFKFDDEWVTKEDMKRAMEEQYGGEEELPQTNPGFYNSPFKFAKYTNAYMLVYIRESDKEKIICNVDESEKNLAEDLGIMLKKEPEEKEQKQKAVSLLFTIIKVARDEDLLKQIGRDRYFDLVDHEKVRSFRIQQQTPFNLFKEEVAKEFDIPVQFQRFWLWAKLQNHTYRPNRPLTPQEEAQSVGQLRELSNKANDAELKLFLEVELGQDLRPVPPPKKTEEEILLFFKLYEPLKEELRYFTNSFLFLGWNYMQLLGFFSVFRYVGRIFVKRIGKPMEILTKLNELAGFAPNEEIELYEEIKFEPNVMCEHIDKKKFSFCFSQLEDGGIICFQKSYRLESSERCRYPDIPSFLEYVHNRQPSVFGKEERLATVQSPTEQSPMMPTVQSSPSMISGPAAPATTQPTPARSVNEETLPPQAPSERTSTDKVSSNSMSSRMKRSILDKLDALFEDLDLLSAPALTSQPRVSSSSPTEEEREKAFKIFKQTVTRELVGLPNFEDQFKNSLDILISSCEFSPEQIDELKQLREILPSLVTDFQSSKRIMDEFGQKLKDHELLLDDLRGNKAEFLKMKDNLCGLEQEEKEVEAEIARLNGRLANLREETKQVEGAIKELYDHSVGTKGKVEQGLIDVPNWEAKRKKAEETSQRAQATWNCFRAKFIEPSA